MEKQILQTFLAIHPLFPDFHKNPTYLLLGFYHLNLVREVRQYIQTLPSLHSFRQHLHKEALFSATSTITKLTEEKRVNVLIIDDTMSERNSSNKGKSPKSPGRFD